MAFALELTSTIEEESSVQVVLIERKIFRQQYVPPLLTVSDSSAVEGRGSTWSSSDSWSSRFLGVDPSSVSQRYAKKSQHDCNNASTLPSPDRTIGKDATRIL